MLEENSCSLVRNSEMITCTVKIKFIRISYGFKEIDFQVNSCKKDERSLLSCVF